ncbi:hypothetical protein [Bacillus xiapuensis]|uniref:hypothetical protein n=1 Tax=Bacillus xiapuensis TaxID=2014075 RepID=UPI000C234CC4|nr:hypothetical protein [Bacillus xiapuensis]
MELVLAYIVIPIMWILIVGWLTGSSEFLFGPKDDERMKTIKQKAVIQSWATLFLFLLTNFLFDLFDLKDARLDQVEFVYPELIYIIILVLSYFVFYWINTKKMSA